MAEQVQVFFLALAAASALIVGVFGMY